MKRLLIVCVLVLLFYTASALAQPNYQFAPATTKDFTTEETISVNDTISLDIWLKDAGATPQTSGGAWIDFSGSTAKISYVSAGRALTNGSEGITGNWDPAAGAFVNEPLGLVGIVLMVNVNLAGAAPDGDGDQLVGTITLECTDGGDAIVNLTTIPDTPTWGPINDSDVVPGSLVIHQEYECLSDEDCKDRLWCTGAETCVDYICVPGMPVCDDSDECSVDPCRESDPICGMIDCEESVGTCTAQYCNTSVVGGATSSCLANPLCACACDCPDDWDGDGVENSTDNCLIIQNPDQADGDGVGDICDNCPSDGNPDQRDDDSDGWGSICDPEDDSDGILYPPDNCPNTSNPDQTNTDTDSYGDACDNCPITPNQDQIDTYPPQGNGIGDDCDCEGNFNCDPNLASDDVDAFIADTGRNIYNNPCTNEEPCNGDFRCDGSVDSNDVSLFIADTGRNTYNNPCPICDPEVAWCVYP